MRPSSLVFFAVLALLLVYTGYRSSQMWPAHRAVAWTLATLFVALTIGWWLLYRSDPSVLSSDWFRALAWAGSIGMGIWATFIFFSAAVDVLHLVVRGSRWIGSRARANPERRTFLSRWIPLGVLWASGGVAGLGFAEAVRGPRVHEVLVPIPNLPAALRGLKIAQISDLHAGPTIQRG
jgi:uncharacterized protein